ncbi:MAG TPA: DUF2142 domain-containing protein [Nocardioidaceae bacterium]|nr:DUF2142 domain-containing protein [Nocardioidaceae bacterium]
MMKPPRVRTRSTVRTVAFVLIGVALVQAAWMLTVPPFRGVDEHEHAYKAAAVARGDWSAHHEASEQGWGELVTVPRSLVEAATPVCESLPYTTADNCRPGAERDGDTVLVASSASRYNPAFYFVIGTAARPFEGTAALYAMRTAGAAMCALLIALAALAARRWARTAWPLAALLTAATPTMLYSTTVAAPNGVEVAGALLVWCALLGLARGPTSSREATWFIAMATAGAIPLVAVRSLGPLWLGLIALTVALLLGRARVGALLRTRAAIVGAVVVLLVMAAGIAWTLGASANDPTAIDPTNSDSPWPKLPMQLVVWLLQSIGVFPTRNEFASLPLYLVAILAWWLLVAFTIRFAHRSERLVLALVFAMTILVPVAAFVATYDRLGTAWQGRYGYPYAMGFILICGWLLDRHAARTATWRWPVWAAAAAVATTQVIGQLGVLRKEVADSPLSGTPDWITPAPAVVVVLTVAGAGLLGWALTRTAEHRPSREVGPEEHAQGGTTTEASSVHA